MRSWRVSPSPGAALLPFAAFLQSSERRARTTLEEAVARSVGPSDLADLVAAPRPEATRLSSPGRGGYLVTLALGPLPLLLAAGVGAGLPGRRRLLAGLGLLAAAGTLLALGTSGLLVPLLFESGLFRGLRFPARWIIFPHLALALAAGAGLDGWLWGRFRKEPALGAGRRRRPRGLREAGPTKGRVRGRSPVVSFSSWSLPPSRGSSRRRERRGTRTGRWRRRCAALLGVAAIALAARALARRHAPRRGLRRRPRARSRSRMSRARPSRRFPPRRSPPRPGSSRRLARGPEAGRVFAPAGQDRTLALRWKYAEGAAWGEGPVRRAALALAGYANLFHGVASVSTASPIGDPRAERLVGAALAGGDAARILALLNVRHVLSPFPASARGFRPAGEDEGLRRYEVQGAFGRAFLPPDARIATDDEAFEALRTPGFDPGRTALVAPLPEGIRLPRPRPSGSWAAARFLSDEPERAELSTSASAASLLVLTRTWDPGWSARIDGDPGPAPPRAPRPPRGRPAARRAPRRARLSARLLPHRPRTLGRGSPRRPRTLAGGSSRRARAVRPEEVLVLPFVFALGAILGSFANVCIHRLPKGESVVSPRSRCPACLTPIAARDNIPVLSWLLLRGRCRACRAPISPRYPLVEALVGAIFFAAAFLHGLGPVSLAGALLATAAVILAATDLEARVLPDEVTFGVLALGLVLAAWRDVAAVRSRRPRGLLGSTSSRPSRARLSARSSSGASVPRTVSFAGRKGWAWAT